MYSVFEPSADDQVGLAPHHFMLVTEGCSVLLKLRRPTSDMWESINPLKAKDIFGNQLS